MKPLTKSHEELVESHGDQNKERPSSGRTRRFARIRSRV